MLRQTHLLVSLVVLMDRFPWPPAPPTRPRGRPKTDSERLLMKALVLMLIRRLYTAYALLTFLDQDDAVAARLRPLLCERGRFPSRRTWARRLATRPPSVPGVIGYGGRHWVALLTPWARHGRAVAVDSPSRATGGGVWHKKHREQGMIPHASIDTPAGWRQSGGHGGWYGWKLHLAVTVGAVGIPLAAELTVANRGDHEVAPLWLQPLPGEVRYVLGDTHDHDPELRRQCQRRGGELVATRRGAYPHRDGGVAVRRIFHTLRSQAIEPCNGLFKNIFAWRVTMPVQGLQCSQLLALGAVVVYQLVLLYQHEHDLPRGKGIKPFLRAA
jgi:Transposase DDE domain